MATVGRTNAIIDTSVLVNFLKIDRTDLLAKHPAYRFIVLDLVRNEVTKRGQTVRLDAAMLSGDVLPDGPPETIDMAELTTFAAMASLKIGNGDKAAIAAASVRALPLAMDDQRAWKRAAAFCVGIPREDTVSLMVSLIKASVLTIIEADTIKVEWVTKHSFAIKHFSSFAERVS